ncbi:MAG: metallophosphoesterase [Verrucomicrobiae bacterium]|nr:metallophosphoesterase [Verrucomicrobiae bacterium]MCP5539434.1 metallophosphoesterase [Akkermansiaceae bacterium]MCP5551108.1 metallophosphoesterase [Akkermansiaceae bacterium]
MNRRNLFRLGFYGSLGAAGYGSLIERRTPVIERAICRLPGRHAALDGLTVATMSDFHHDEFHDNSLMAGAVETLNGLNPDLVLLPGDFISRDERGVDTLADHLARLRAPLGVFASLGNHDQWADAGAIVRRLSRAGIPVLRNAATRLRAPRSGAVFHLGGLESAWAGHPDFARLARGIPRDEPIVLGWHEPDPFDTLADPRVLLQVAGHTHGGQVCAPLWGAIKLPRHGRKYVAGLFERGDARLYVTRGIGSMGVPVRFCCPPEISLIEFRATADRQPEKTLNA